MSHLKVKLLRSLTKKNYGIARFKSGIHIHPRVVNLGKGNVKFRGGLWLFDKDSIYYEHPEKNITKKIGIVEDIAEFDEGIPIITLNVDDAVAARYADNDDLKGSRNPYALEASIDKHISASEAEIMRKTKSKLSKMVMISLIVSFINVALTVFVAAKVA